MSQECPGHVPGVSVMCPRSVQDMSQECPGHVSGVSGTCPGSVPEMPKKCPGHVPGVSRPYPRSVQDMSQECPDPSLHARTKFTYIELLAGGCTGSLLSILPVHSLTLSCEWLWIGNVHRGSVHCVSERNKNRIRILHAFIQLRYIHTYMYMRDVGSHTPRVGGKGDWGACQQGDIRLLLGPQKKLSYSAKFSRRIIFAVFADWSPTVKIKQAKCFFLYVCIRSILGPRNLFPRTVQYDQTVKIMRLENLALYGSYY